MTPRTFLDLGRVSNLPTVWTNVLAGAAVSGGRLEPLPLGLMVLAGSLLYVGGMFLNDAFDREFDSRARSERPIPSGRATFPEVLAIGVFLLVAGVALAGLVGSAVALAAGIALAGLIVFYDAFHKRNPLSAVVMGSCRAGLYLLAAVSLGGVEGRIVGSAFVLFAYVVGLSGVARQETRTAVGTLGPVVLLGISFAYVLVVGFTTDVPQVGVAGAVTALVGATFLAWCLYSLSFLHPRRGPRIPRTVTSLIAGISLLDAVLIALHGQPALALAAALGLPLTVLGQRYVKGT
jgi:4-hydroxybenzoate polyprenyltransferase